MQSRYYFLTGLILAGAFACAQNRATSTSAMSASSVDNDFVQKQFGSSCTLNSEFPPMTADLNGDGIDDIVIVARCKNPLIDQDEKDYKVIDPLDSFYGYGNPKVTTGFATEDPKLRGISLLVIHGAEVNAWRSATPQAKFVIINVPIKTITVKKMKVNKKKSTVAIYVEEASGDQMTSAIFWDGKKYRYDPLGSSME
jgi:hypothetical protein